MIIKERTIYETQFDKEDIESFNKVIGMFYEFKNNPKSLSENQKERNKMLERVNDSIELLTDLGGKELKKELRRAS